MPTIIDSLIVKLGLDATQYKRGREQAERETGETARKVRQSGDDITKSLLDVGRTIANLFLGFETISGFSKFLGSLNASQAALGRTASQLGIGVHELNKWGNAVALAGGDAADAQAAFRTLTDEALRFQSGQGIGPLLTLLKQAGVNAFDATGKLRDQGEVLDELATKTAHWGAQWQAVRFKAAGLSEGEIAYLTLSQAKRKELVALAERDNAVTAESARKAQELQQYWRDIGLEVESLGQKILLGVTPAVKGVFSAVSDTFEQ